VSHDTVLIGTIAAGLGVAFVLGLLSARLGLPPLIGYLVAGIVVGPFTPGYVADSGIAGQLAEFGVILLMFGVGLHFSLGDLVAVRRIVVPGALLQTIITTTVGAALARLWGSSWGNAVVLGMCLGVASTAVLLKALEARDRLDSPEGRLAVGWLVVEDVSMVLALVLLPAVAPMFAGDTSAGIDFVVLSKSIAIALAKVAAFVALMFFVGRRFVPWLLARVVTLGSRELFTLAVLVMALGVGTIASELFGVSFALGAFFAGAVISESELSRRAAADALPMQDAFAVLFFVSVGMLFDPKVLIRHPLEVVTIVAIVVIWKSVLAGALVRLLGESKRTAVLVGTSLGQIGEFSFVVAALGVSLGLATRDTQALVVAAAIAAITLNGAVINAATRFLRGGKTAQQPVAPVVALDSDQFDCIDLSGHVVLVGYGRVGSTVAEALGRAGAQHVVVEERERIVDGLRRRHERAIQGDASRAEVLDRAGISRARLIVITAPEPFHARRIAEVARAANPNIVIAVRTHSAAEQAFFEEYFAAPTMGRAVYAERVAALSLAHYSLMALGRPDDDADIIIGSMRDRPTAATETFKIGMTTELRAPAAPH
jgi:CPA2 family monovalent cation:H+ antiporter-2